MAIRKKIYNFTVCIAPTYFVRQTEHKSSSDSGFYLVKNYYNNSSSFHTKNLPFQDFPHPENLPTCTICLGIQSSGNIC